MPIPTKKLLTRKYSCTTRYPTKVNIDGHRKFHRTFASDKKTNYTEKKRTHKGGNTIPS